MLSVIVIYQRYGFTHLVWTSVRSFVAFRIHACRVPPRTGCQRNNSSDYLRLHIDFSVLRRRNRRTEYLCNRKSCRDRNLYWYRKTIYFWMVVTKLWSQISTIDAALRPCDLSKPCQSAQYIDMTLIKISFTNISLIPPGTWRTVNIISNCGESLIHY